MAFFLTIVVTVWVICLIATTVFAFTWWKSNHGVVQRRLTEGGGESEENRAGYAADVAVAEETGAQHIEALLTEYAKEILIDDYLARGKTYMTRLITRIAEYNVKKMAEEAAAAALRGKVNVLSARAVVEIKKKTKPDKILEFLGIPEATSEGYVNVYVVNYHNSLDNMDVDSLAKAAADKVTGDFIKKRFGDKTAYVTAYVRGANEIEGRLEDQVALVNGLFVYNLDPSKSSETHSIRDK